MIITLVLTYALFCIALFVFQRTLIYYPQPAHNRNNIEVLSLVSDKESIQVSVKPLNTDNAVIYFGGNAEDVSFSLPAYARIFPNDAIYMMHYRGYADSTGKPSEQGLYNDALNLYDKVAKQHSHITVIGRSIGSGIATRLASERQIARLVLVTPFYSLEETAAQQFPWFPARWLLLDKFQSWRYAKNIAIPTLIIVAEQDEIVKPSDSERLFHEFNPGIAKLKRLPGEDHNSISTNPDYWLALKFD
ncbi:alpha/beta hydrolase [Methylocucumis oryzae]|nr:alpha/beta hydrolase [Methylocucumis oryzae]